MFKRKFLFAFLGFCIALIAYSGVVFGSTEIKEFDDGWFNSAGRLEQGQSISYQFQVDGLSNVMLNVWSESGDVLGRNVTATVRNRGGVALVGPVVLPLDTRILSGLRPQDGPFTLTLRNGATSLNTNVDYGVGARVVSAHRVDVNASGGGTATARLGSGTGLNSVFASTDDLVTLVAIPQPGFAFVNWTVTSRRESGGLIHGAAILGSPTDTTTTMLLPAPGNDQNMLPGNVTIQANFIPQQTITLVPVPNGGTLTSNVTAAAPGTTVVLAATPATNFVFDRWVVVVGGVTFAEITNAHTTFTMGTSDVVITARFNRVSTITLAATQGGTIATSVFTAAVGSTVNLTATVNEGWRFNRWNVTAGGVVIDGVNNTSASFTMGEAPVSISAVFDERRTVSVSQIQGGGGSIAVDRTSAFVGDTITLTGTIYNTRTHIFERWTLTGGGATPADANSLVTTFVMPNANVAVSAQIRARTPAEILHSVSVQSSNLNFGTVTTSRNDAAQGTAVTVTATPRNGGIFERWEILGGGVTLNNAESATATFTMGADNVIVRAVFTRAAFTITTRPDLPARGTVVASTDRGDTGDRIRIVAAPRAGFVFVNWRLASGNGSFAQSTNMETDFTVGSMNATVEAVFRAVFPHETSNAWQDYARLLNNHEPFLNSANLGQRLSALAGGSTVNVAGNSFHLVIVVVANSPARFYVDGQLRTLTATTGPDAAPTVAGAPYTRVSEVSVALAGGGTGRAQVFIHNSAGQALLAQLDTRITQNLATLTPQTSTVQSVSYWQNAAAAAHAVEPFKDSVEAATKMSTFIGSQTFVHQNNTINTVVVQNRDTSRFFINGVETTFSGTGTNQPPSNSGSGYRSFDVTIPLADGTQARLTIFVHEAADANALTRAREAVNTSVAALQNTATTQGGTTGPRYVVRDAPATMLTGVSSWAREEVTRAITFGFVPEALASNFNTPITREEFCRIVIYAMVAKTGFYGNLVGFTTQYSVPLLSTPFTDTTDVYVGIAHAINIVNGIGDNLFAPAAHITRQEAATMLVRAGVVLGLPGAAGTPATTPFLNNFTDFGDVAVWARNGIEVAASHGIMQGVGMGMFDPLGLYTREQAMISILRLFEASPSVV
jgi:hypothetical protein